MEVINSNAAMLSNYEVYQLLKDIQAGKGQKRLSKHQKHLSTITYETLKYLESTSCKLHTPEVIEQLTKVFKPFKLTKAEVLQILNMRPTTAVEIQLVIEESEERLTEEQIYELIDLIIATIPEDKPEEEEGKEEAD